MRKIKWLIVLVIILTGIAFWLFRSSSPKERLTIQTSTVNKGDILSMVTATGTVEPITQVEVGTQVSGIIDKIYVDYNSEVKKGDLLAELDKTVLQSEVASQKSLMLSNKIEQEYQERNYNRIKLLHDKELVSDQEYETALYQYEKAKNTYEKSVSDMVKAERNLSYATIYSPIDGVVLSRAVDEGQTVAASFSTPTLFTIANDLTKMQVVANVDEAEIGQVSDSQRVSFYVDAFPDDVFEGEVIQVRQEATITSNVVTYEVIVNAPNPELKLKPGLTANITIYTMEKKDILTLPNRALRFNPDPNILGDSVKIISAENKGNASNTRTVWQKQNGTLSAKSITIGESNGILTEILSGISEGEKVITDISISTAQQPQSKGNGTETSPFMPQRPGGNRR